MLVWRRVDIYPAPYHRLNYQSHLDRVSSNIRSSRPGMVMNLFLHIDTWICLFSEYLYIGFIGMERMKQGWNRDDLWWQRSGHIMYVVLLIWFQIQIKKCMCLSRQYTVLVYVLKLNLARRHRVLEMAWNSGCFFFCPSHRVIFCKRSCGQRPKALHGVTVDRNVSTLLKGTPNRC